MIQRIQTVFLFLAALVFGSLLKLPLAVSNKPSVQFLSDSVFDVTDHPALIGLTILGSVIALISIFLYKKRPVQLKLGYVIIVVAILLPLISFLLFTNASAGADPSVQVADQAGMYMPVAAILFAALANHFIKKDNKLVKSMDRLR
jgi:hypothetical protein